MSKNIIKRATDLALAVGWLPVIMALGVITGCASNNPALTVGGTFVQSVGTMEKSKAVILLGISEYNRHDSAKIIGRVVQPGLIIARQDGNDWWLEIAIRYNPENFQLDFNACSESLGNADNIHDRFQKTQRLLMDYITRVASQYSASQDLQWRQDARTPVY